MDHYTHIWQLKYPNSHCRCIADAKARGVAKTVIEKSLIAIDMMNIFVGERNDLSKVKILKMVIFPINPNDIMSIKAIKRHV